MIPNCKKNDSKWNNAVANSEVLASGVCKYITIGNFLFVQIKDLKPKQDIKTNQTMLFSGLPNAIEETFIVADINGKTSRLHLGGGKIQTWYSTLLNTTSDQFYGNVIAKKL